MAKNLLLILVSSLFTLVALEVLIRIIVPQSDRFYQVDKNLGSILKPNYQGWWYGEYVSNREFANKVTTNSFGFHDVEHPLQNPAASRVVLLGDSYLETLQVPLEKTVARVLERELNQSETRWEVIALGRAGASTAEEIVLWEEWGRRFKPRFVGIMFSQNDLLENERLTRETQGRPRFWLEDGQLKRLPPIIEFATRVKIIGSPADSAGRRILEPSSDIASFIADHSHLARFLFRFKLNQEKRTELASQAYETALSHLKLSLTPKLLEVLLTKIKATGAQPVMIFVDDDPNANPILAPIVELLEAHHVKIIALGDKQDPANRRYFFFFDGHLNEKGHRHLATLIAPALLD